MRSQRAGKSLFLIAFVVTSVAISGGAALWIARSTDPLAEAEKAYQKGDWERAGALSKDRLKIKADDTEALRILARSAARLGRDDSALSLYKKRLGGATLTNEDHFLMGQLIGRQGNIDLALNIWEKAAQSPPEHAELLEALARLSAQMHHLEEAAEISQRLLQLPGWEARGLLMLGTFRSMMDDSSGSVEALEKGLKLDPEAGTAPFSPRQNVKLLVRNLLRLGRPAEARGYLAKQLPTSEIDLEAFWLASRVELQEGKTEQARLLNAQAGDYRAQNPAVPEPSPYVGSSRCESCHSGISKSYVKSRHARTFYKGGELLELPRPDRPLPDPEYPKITHTFERDGDQIRVLSRIDEKTFKLIVDFAFGTPERYLSMVGRDEEGAYRAVRLSYHHHGTDTGWDRTAGDNSSADPLSNMRGQKIDTRDGIVRCLGCHVTNPRDFRNPNKGPVAQSPAALDSSIGCERCHGPGANHIAAAKIDLVHQTMVNAGSASAKVVNAQCGECHTVGDSAVIRRSPEDPQWVRSTGVTFTFSRCYTESSGALSCLSCHDPHRDSSSESAYYEAKCLQCHSSAAQSKTVCKVSPTKDCLGCHMPKVPTPVLHTSLTDHYIRVHKTKQEPQRTPSGEISKAR